MFTGLIEEVGHVRKFAQTARGRILEIETAHLAPSVKIGESVAVNGCCLTVTRSLEHALSFDLLAETIARTSFTELESAALVNLERAVAVGDRMGGHFVQGHIDGTGRMASIDKLGSDLRLEISASPQQLRYLVEKGSIALDGISLTVAELRAESFVVGIIPHTWQHTNLRSAQVGGLVNLEFDLLAKYVERLLPRRAPDA